MLIQAFIYNILNLISLYTAVGFFSILKALGYYDIKEETV